MKQIKFLTSNQIKISIASEILNKYDITVKQQSFPFKELQSSNIIAVAMDKADQALIGKVGGDFIIDDSGMYVECLNGFPGAMLKEVFLSANISSAIIFKSNSRTLAESFTLLCKILNVSASNKMCIGNSFLWCYGLSSDSLSVQFLTFWRRFHSRNPFRDGWRIGWDGSKHEI